MRDLVLYGPEDNTFYYGSFWLLVASMVLQVVVAIFIILISSFNISIKPGETVKRSHCNKAIAILALVIAVINIIQASLAGNYSEPPQTTNETTLN